jgi:hypothetical protein
MSKIDESLDILKNLGLPKAQHNDRSALTLLALANLNETSLWSQARTRNIRIHDILVFIQKNYDKEYAENTRETIRRQTLHQFEQAGIVERNADNPSRPTNSPHTVYTISNETAKLIRKFGTSYWEPALNQFLKKQGKLIDQYDKRKKANLLKLSLPDNLSIEFSPGKHNQLQIKIIHEFRKRFCPAANIIYIGDTSRKLLHIEAKVLEELGISINQHDKLPDIVLYDSKKNQLFLIEAVTAHGPLSPKRQIELEKTFSKTKAKRIYISAFPDFHEFKKHIGNIAWDTEVWIADNPDHMVHFNGTKFFTVYNG